MLIFMCSMILSEYPDRRLCAGQRLRTIAAGTVFDQRMTPLALIDVILHSKYDIFY